MYSTSAGAGSHPAKVQVRSALCLIFSNTKTIVCHDKLGTRKLKNESRFCTGSATAVSARRARGDGGWPLAGLALLAAAIVTAGGFQAKQKIFRKTAAVHLNPGEGIYDSKGPVVGESSDSTAAEII